MLSEHLLDRNPRQSCLLSAVGCFSVHAPAEESV